MFADMENVTENTETEVTGDTVAEATGVMVTEVFTDKVTDVSTSMWMDAMVGLTSNITVMSDVTLQQLTDEEFYRRLTPVIYLSILMAVGIPGNLLVLVVYFRDFTKSTHRTFILVLAALDLAVSTIALPFEITEMRYQYMFYAVTVCKIFRANNIFLTIGSMFIILTMSIERYRRICYPLKPQMTTRVCRISCVCVIVFSLISSSANFVTSGIRHVKLRNNLTGSDCSLDDSFSQSDFPLVLDAAMFLLAMGTFTTILVLYSLIARQIYKQNKFRRKFAVPKQCPSPHMAEGITQDDGTTVTIQSMTIDLSEQIVSFTENSTNTNNVNSSTCINGSPPIMTVCKNSTPKFTDDNDFLPKQSTRTLSTKLQSKGTTKVTKIAFTVSLVFILSYLPYLVLSLATSLKRGFVAEPGPITSALLPIVTRSIFVNNVANPFIYGFLDPKFRRSCKNRMKMMFRCDRE